MFFKFRQTLKIATKHRSIELRLQQSALKKLVKQSQIVQNAIYGSDTVVIQVLTLAVCFLGSQLDLFPFAEYERTKT